MTSPSDIELRQIIINMIILFGSKKLECDKLTESNLTYWNFNESPQLA